MSKQLAQGSLDALCVDSTCNNLWGRAHMFRSRALDMEDFKTEVSIAPGAKVQFELHYQEVKWRKLGSYEHRVHLKPGRLAKHLEVSPPSSSWVPICAFRSSSLRGVPRHLTLQDRVVYGN